MGIEIPVVAGLLRRWGLNNGAARGRDDVAEMERSVTNSGALSVMDRAACAQTDGMSWGFR